MTKQSGGRGSAAGVAAVAPPRICYNAGMMEWRETYLSVRRAVVLAAALLGLGALLAACAPAEEATPPPVAVVPPEAVAEPLPEPDPVAVLVARSTLRAGADAGAGEPRRDAPESAPKPDESGRYCFTANADPDCPPILLNDPPPPIHTGGEPYPPGTFPPELAPLWENVTEDFMQPGSYWGEASACATAITGFGQIRNQWLFSYEEELEDPLADIVAELLAAGVEFESVTVTTKEYYDQYDPETFINWLSVGESQFDPVSALASLGGEVHPGAFDTYWNDPGPRYGAVNFRYQVKVHGLSMGGEERVSALRNAGSVGFADPCRVDPSRSGRVLRWLVGGLYTTFGDDVVLLQRVIECGDDEAERRELRLMWWHCWD